MMGGIRPVTPVKLFCGILFLEQDACEEAISLMELGYGPADVRTESLPFTATNYYSEEMGHPLFRVFVSFETLIQPGLLPDIKLETNRIEKTLREKTGAAGRPVNLDPGYLSAYQIVLASTKNYAHRIFLRDGIYGEIEFFFKREGIRCLEWTYPDYRSEKYHRIFLRIRSIYLKQIKNWVPGA